MEEIFVNILPDFWAIISKRLRIPALGVIINRTYMNNLRQKWNFFVEFKRIHSLNEDVENKLGM